MKMLFEVDKDGDVFIQDSRIAMMPKLWQIYKSKDGDKYVKFIIYVYDYHSPYRTKPLKERMRMVGDVIFGEKFNQKNLHNKKIEEAADEYIKVQYDPLMDQYQLYNEKIKEINDYLRSQSVNSENAEDIAKLMNAQFKITESRDKLSDMIIQRGDKEAKIHGGGNISRLEQMQMEDKI